MNTPPKARDILEKFRKQCVNKGGGIGFEETIAQLKEALLEGMPKKSHKAQKAYRIESNDFAAVVKEKARNQGIDQATQAIEAFFEGR